MRRLELRKPDGAGLAALLVLALVLITAPAAVISDVPFDLFIPLDAGWRVVHGQIPHIDFHTPVGVLWYALYGGCVAVMGATERVLLVAPVVGAIPVVLAALVALMGRLDAEPRAMVTVFVGLTAFSPRALDGAALAFLASYNRIGWALVVVALLLLLLPRPERRAEWVDGGLLLGILLALFFTKITYFGVVGLGCGLALLIPENRRFAVAGGLGAWVVVGLLWLVSDLPGAYVDDLIRTASSHAPGNERTGLGKLGADVVANLPAVALTALMLGWAARRDHSWRDPFLAISVLVLGLATAQQSHDHQIPAVVVAVVIAARHVGRAIPEAGLLPGIGLGGAVALPVVADTVAIVQNAVSSRSPGSTVEAWPGAAIRFPGTEADLKLDQLNDGRVSEIAYFTDQPAVSGPDLALLLSEGREIVSAQLAPDDRVLTLTSSQAFSWLTGTPPPRGIDAWYDYGRTFGPDRPVDAAETLAEVTVVMDPIGLQTGTIDELVDDLTPALEADFESHETPLWRVWTRRAPATGE